MRLKSSHLALSLAGSILMTGCATTPVTTDVEMTGMANPEVALRRSMDLVNNQMGELNGLRSVRPIPAMAAYQASVSPAPAAPGQPIVLVPRAGTAAASAVTIAPVVATPQDIAPAGSPSIVAFPPPTRSGAVVPEELQRPIGFAWKGLLDEGVRKVADQVGYRVEVTGPPQIRPIGVIIPNASTTLIGALKAMGTQAGTWATVRVDPINRRIEVVHHV